MWFFMDIFVWFLAFWLMPTGLVLVGWFTKDDEEERWDLIVYWLLFPILGIVICTCSLLIFGSTNPGFVIGIWLLGIGAVISPIYALPTSLAIRKQKKNLKAIFALNLLAGWAFFGYVAALVWALTEDD